MSTFENKNFEKIENIDENDLEYILKEYALPDSNIGVHKMTGSTNYDELRTIYNNILKDGFNASGGEKSSHGLWSHIYMCGMKKPNTSKEIMGWEYGAMLDYGTKIIFAIPRIIETTNNKYYIGDFPKWSSKTRDEYRSIEYNRVNKIPSEFILGKIEVKYGDFNKSGIMEKENTFVLNHNYIGFKTKEEQLEFYDNYEEILDHYSIRMDLDCYEYARDIIRDLLDGESDYYYRECMEAISDELAQNKGKGRL